MILYQLTYYLKVYSTDILSEGLLFPHDILSEGLLFPTDILSEGLLFLSKRTLQKFENTKGLIRSSKAMKDR